MELKTFFTPGHTKGATSWTMEVTEKGKNLKVVFASSVTTLDYVFLDNKQYPQIAEDFAKTYQTLRAIRADIFLASHGVFFNLKTKAERLRAGAKANPFIDAKGYRKFVEGMSKAFQDKLKAEKEGKKL